MLRARFARDARPRPAYREGVILPALALAMLAQPAAGPEPWLERARAALTRGEVAQAHVDALQAVTFGATPELVTLLFKIERADRAQTTCDWARVLRLVPAERRVSATPGERFPDVLDRPSPCGHPEACVGASTVLRLGKGKRTATTAVRLKNVKGTFLVDPGLGHSVVRREFARRAGMKAHFDKVVSITLNGEAKQGRLVLAFELSVGNLTLNGLQLAAVDGLPAGVDGVLGQNALLACASRVSTDQIELVGDEEW